MRGSLERWYSIDNDPESRETGTSLFVDIRLLDNGLVTIPESEFLDKTGLFDPNALVRACFSVLNVVKTTKDTPFLDGDENIEGWSRGVDGRILIHPNQVRENFYKKYPDVDDRTHQLVPNYRDIMNAVNGSLRRLGPLLLRMFNAIHPKQDKTGVFGVSYSELLVHGWNVTEKNLFEAKPWPVAVSFARELRERIGLMRNSQKYPNTEKVKTMPILELGTGSGTLTFALAQKNPDLVETEVLTLDNQHTVIGYLRDNLRLPWLSAMNAFGLIESDTVNVVDFLRNRNGESNRRFGKFHFAAIMADPPWRAAFATKELRVRNLRQMFFLSGRGEYMLDPKPEKIKNILKSIEETSGTPERLMRLKDEYDLWTAEDVVAFVFAHNIAPMVSFHVPPPEKDFDLESVYETASRLNAEVEVIKHVGNDGERHLEEYQVIFYKHTGNKTPTHGRYDVNF